MEKDFLVPEISIIKSDLRKKRVLHLEAAVVLVEGVNSRISTPISPAPLPHSGSLAHACGGDGVTGLPCLGGSL